jgi:protocatechuate 3,4-dioxygenase beta subunit
MSSTTTSPASTPGEPLGERISVTGRLRGSDGRPIPGQLVEIWQANAAGRYRHAVDTHPAPPRPELHGRRKVSDRRERRVPLRHREAGAYPWKNHENAWRPAHIHFSVFGRAIPDRLVTQMYFPTTRSSVRSDLQLHPRREARERLISSFELDLTQPECRSGSLRHRLGGRGATPLEEPHDD